MGFIGSLEGSHAKEKKEFFEEVLAQEQFDLALILGAQSGEVDVELISGLLPTIAVDIRKDPLDDLVKRHKYIYPVHTDITKLRGLNSAINITLSLNPKRVLCYDNTSGSPNRIQHAVYLLDVFQSMFMYSHKRLGMCRLLFENFGVLRERNLSANNAIVQITSNKNLNTININDSTIYNINRRNRIKFESEHKCIFCGAKPPKLYYSEKKNTLTCYKCSRKWNPKEVPDGYNNVQF